MGSNILRDKALALTNVCLGVGVGFGVWVSIILTTSRDVVRRFNTKRFLFCIENILLLILF